MQDEMANVFGEEALKHFQEIHDVYGIKMCENLLYKKQIQLDEDTQKSYLNIFESRFI